MNGKSPFFSIVMPTRNRAHFLRCSLQTALEQTYDDYEIVVSDNYSSDDTPKVVQELGNQRVRYVRTDKALSMPESWEFALSHARGEYVTFLSDDEARSPRLLETAAKIISERNVELVVWPYCCYYYSTWYDRLCRNALSIFPFTAQVYDLDSLPTLTGWFTSFSSVGRLPLLTNSVYHRALIGRVKSQVLRLTPILAWDIFSAILILSEVDKYCYVDIPLVIFGMGEQSITSSLLHYRNGAGMAYIEEFPDQGNLQHVPLRMLTMHNFMADALLEAKKAVGDKLRSMELDWEQYFVKCYEDLMHLKNRNINICSDLEEFHRVLSHRPSDLQERVLSSIESLQNYDKNPWKKVMRRLINNSSILMRLEMLLRPQVKFTRDSFIRGEEAGFNNILECARKFDSILLNCFAQYRAYSKYYPVGNVPRHVIEA